MILQWEVSHDACLFASLVLVAVAVVIYGGLRILRPDLYPGDPLLGGIVHDLDRALLHLDFGCAPPGGTGSGARPSGHCTPLRAVWQRGMAADIWLLAGSVVIVVGVLGGLWLAAVALAREQGVGTIVHVSAATATGLRCSRRSWPPRSAPRECCACRAIRWLASTVWRT